MSEFSRLTLRQLAAKVHDAEETADDVTLMECWDELERRRPADPRISLVSLFLEFYRDEWRRRMSR